MSHDSRDRHEEALLGMHIHRMGLKLKKGNRNLNKQGEFRIRIQNSSQ